MALPAQSGALFFKYIQPKLCIDFQAWEHDQLRSRACQVFHSLPSPMLDIPSSLADIVEKETYSQPGNLQIHHPPPTQRQALHPS